MPGSGQALRLEYLTIYFSNTKLAEFPLSLLYCFGLLSVVLEASESKSALIPPPDVCLQARSQHDTS